MIRSDGALRLAVFADLPPFKLGMSRRLLKYLAPLELATFQVRHIQGKG